MDGFGEVGRMVTRESMRYSDSEGENRQPDEGWWAAVLSDETLNVSTLKENPAVSGESQSAPQDKDWDTLLDLYEKDEVITLRVYGYNRGGVLVQGDHLQGFVPVSHLVNVQQGLSEEQRRSALAEYMGKLLNLKVIECEPEEDRVVFSERAGLAGKGRRRLLFDSLAPGKSVRGVVTNVTDFGVFVDLGGLEGLVHVSELSWGRVQHPGEVVKVGEEVDAIVLQVYEETGRVALSIKRLTRNPWDLISARYLPGDVAHAVVTSVARFGVFARLEEGIEGLIHISLMKVPTGRADLKGAYKEGQPVLVRIVHIDTQKRRLSLSLVALEQEE